MDKAIRGIIELIFKMITSFSSDSKLTLSFTDYAPNVYKFVESIMTTVTLPVGYSILGLFFLLEMQRIAYKVEQMGGSQFGFQTTGMTLVKLVLCKIAMDSISLILKAISEVSIFLVGEIAKVEFASAVGQNTVSIDKLMEPISKSGFFEQLVLFIIMLLVLILTIISTVIAHVLLLARMIELYVLFAFSPIPIATMPNQEHSSIAKNFLKLFASGCIHGTVIYLVMLMYPLFIAQGLLNASQLDVWNTIGTVAGFSFLLIFALMKTQQLSKAIVGAM
ncbi:hypothetical protein GMA11_06205 [Granulicatella sp. zg-ZJ]|uniref:hypothetical protein n=1 Tax=Granulicatella sp. zg-ZJ TaxID=2678504 RepID=UPI0013D49D65|nr:hypothetical protein [Granulicatella sp. zg-ZJ]NEW62438.1 hypothetical protein [Granulicatella sp. zg-ZJ]NEW62984.1 hypothetical protein [Granulicatella sp. zg-ZJ]